LKKGGNIIYNPGKNKFTYKNQNLNNSSVVNTVNYDNDDDEMVNLEHPN